MLSLIPDVKQSFGLVVLTQYKPKPLVFDNLGKTLNSQLSFSRITDSTFKCKHVMLIVCACPLTISLFDECTVRVDASSPFGLQFSQSQDVLQAIQSHLNYFGVHKCEQVTKRFYATKFH